MYERSWNKSWKMKQKKERVIWYDEEYDIVPTFSDVFKGIRNMTLD